jgi:NADPH:quinone reductase-like Zn-dependent oxidoreductase
VVSLVAHASAIYCLDDLGKISNDEIILITPDIGPAGNVLSYIARERGFSVFAPYSSPEEYAYLVECLQLPLTNIFSVDSEGLASWSLEMVPGCEAGFDVVVSRPASRFLAEALQNIAPMGRVVQIGSRKFSDSEDRSACGLCFDWRKMHRFKPRFLMRILRRGINEARRRRREGLPIGVSAEYFEVDDFLGAFRSFNYRSTSVPIVSFHRSIGKNLIVRNFSLLSLFFPPFRELRRI